VTDTAAPPVDSGPGSEFDVGAHVPPYVRPAGLEAWNRYAAVNDEFVGIHMDDAAGQAAGYPGAIGMGNLIWAWLHCTVESWLAGRGRLEHLECRFRRPALKGDSITCTGVVVGREEDAGSAVLEVELWAENQSGERIAPARARVRVAAAGDR
jgi:acyl dehydratase